MRGTDTDGRETCSCSGLRMRGMARHKAQHKVFAKGNRELSETGNRMQSTGRIMVEMWLGS